MKELRICFPIDDVEMKEAVDKEFGENVTYIEERSATGMEIIFVAVIPITALTVQILDFILTHFVPKDDEDKKKKSGRKIEFSGSRMTLYNYEPEEAVKIIKGLYK